MADTDLTEAISNDEDDEKEEAPPATTIKPPSGRSRPRRSVAKPTLPDKPKGKSTKAIEAEDPYPPNTLVWAKLTSFPYFPAEIIDVTNDDPSEIPPSVFQNRTQAEKENGAQGQRTWLVRFFDSQNSYGWIPAKKLDLLGENNGGNPFFSTRVNPLIRHTDIDEMYLSVSVLATVHHRVTESIVRVVRRVVTRGSRVSISKPRVVRPIGECCRRDLLPSCSQLSSFSAPH